MSETKKVALPSGGFVLAQMHAGRPDAPVIVLSNSVLTDMHIWAHQVPALTASFSVMCYDQRGHGQSSISSTPLTFDDFGADILALLDAYELHSCIFLGLSMGVPSGLAAMAVAPERFKAFVAVDGVARSAVGREAFWSERRGTARAIGLAQLAEDTAQRWLPGESKASDVFSRLKQIMLDTPVEGFADATYALQNYDYSSELIRLDIPFLAIAGAEDGAMPDAMRQQFSAIPGARFDVIEHAGHVPNFQRPEAFNSTVLGFLGSLDKLAPVTEDQLSVAAENQYKDKHS